jgi:hypothetical protein
MKRQVKLRIPRTLFEEILKDLRREHEFAFERVGFLFGKTKRFENEMSIVFLNEYRPVSDKNYIRDSSVGARINSNAITEAMGITFEGKKSSFHTHLHDFEFDNVMPQFSMVDKDELPPIAKSAISFSRDQAHGIIVLSGNSINALVFLDGETAPIVPSQITIVGYPMTFTFPGKSLNYETQEQFQRQSFLGLNAQALISRLKIGVVGLGGGGSHMVQQLSHLGFKKYALFDGQIVEESNLNRMVGATLSDVKNQISKFEIASRLIKSLNPDAEISGGKLTWQEFPQAIQTCDIVVGCLDTFAARRDLEAECRRFMIPYIDIGMDIMKVGEDPFNMFGQVQLSMPGETCLICRGFLSEDNLSKEANKYGHSGDRPQVVWANGVLASSAVGVLVDLITNWSKISNRSVYLSYEGNRGLVSNHVKLQYELYKECSHYKISATGPVDL